MNGEISGTTDGGPRFYQFSCLWQEDALCVHSREMIRERPRLIRGEWLPEQPIVFDHDNGRQPLDLVSSGATVHLLSESACSVFRRRGLTGWIEYPIEIRGRDSQPIHGYRGISVMGRCGPIIDERSPVEWRDPIVKGGRPFRVHRGYWFEPTSWDGSDFFIPESYKGHLIVTIFATERVREAVEEAQLTNIRLRRIEEIDRRFAGSGE